MSKRVLIDLLNSTFINPSMHYVNIYILMTFILCHMIEFVLGNLLAGHFLSVETFLKRIPTLWENLEQTNLKVFVTDCLEKKPDTKEIRKRMFGIVNPDSELAKKTLDIEASVRESDRSAYTQMGISLPNPIHYFLIELKNYDIKSSHLITASLVHVFETIGTKPIDIALFTEKWLHKWKGNHTAYQVKESVVGKVDIEFVKANIAPDKLKEELALENFKPTDSAVIESIMEEHLKNPNVIQSKIEEIERKNKADEEKEKKRTNTLPKEEIDQISKEADKKVNEFIKEKKEISKKTNQK